MARHFPYQHPLFGRSKNSLSTKSYENSVYYWWYEYLRRNEDYRITCENSGVGPCSELFKDFGNVHGCDFKTWWKYNDRGAMLFAEQARHSILVVEQNSTLDMSLLDNCILLNVNTAIPMTQLLNKFKAIVLKEAAKKTKSSSSTAKYRVTGKVDLNFLSKALKVYDAKRENPQKQLWKIANEFELGPKTYRDKLKIITINSPDLSELKSTLAIIASRHYKKAKDMIEKAGRGIFPN